MTKHAAEQLHLLYGELYGMLATSIRLTNVYGPRQWLLGDLQGRYARVDHRHVGVCRRQRPREVRADEAQPAGDQAPLPAKRASEMRVDKSVAHDRRPSQSRREGKMNVDDR